MDLQADQVYSTNDSRVDNRVSLNLMLRIEFLKRTLTEWLDIFDRSGLPYGALNDVVNPMEHPQTIAPDMIEVIEDFQPAADGIVTRISHKVFKFEATGQKEPSWDIIKIADLSL